MYVHPDSQPKPLFAGARGGCLIVLLCLSVVGFFAEYYAYRHLLARSGYERDGFNEAPLYLSVMFFGPIQLAASIMLVVGLRRASLPRIDA
jgi:hypothetical protein